MEKKETRLKQYLRSHGIKQTWLASEVGMTQAWFNRVVNAKSIPTVFDALKIARVLGCSVEDLWHEDEEELVEHRSKLPRE